MRIKAVTFDLDDTLWAVDPVIERANRVLWEWLHAMAPAFTARFTPDDFVEGSPLRQQCLSRYPHLAHSVTQIRLCLLRQGLEAVGYELPDAERLAQAAFDAFLSARHEVELFAGAAAMLRSLHAQGLRLGALSNGNAEVSRTGVAQWFDFQFNADQVGSAKPHPRMFELALRQLQLPASQVVHVGDHPINDVQAATQLGMGVIWVNLQQQPWPLPDPAPPQVTALEQIPGLIAHWQSPV